MQIDVQYLFVAICILILGFHSALWGLGDLRPHWVLLLWLGRVPLMLVSYWCFWRGDAWKSQWCLCKLQCTSWWRLWMWIATRQRSQTHSVISIDIFVLIWLTVFKLRWNTKDRFCCQLSEYQGCKTRPRSSLALFCLLLHDLRDIWMHAVQFRLYRNQQSLEILNHGQAFLISKQNERTLILHMLINIWINEMLHEAH